MDINFATPIANYYRLFLSCVFLLVTMACSSTDTPPLTELATEAPAAIKKATLKWNANSESDLEGYKIYMATATGGYGAPIATVPKDETSHIVTGLDAGVTYFFVVTAYNSSGVESSFSNEVSTIVL